MWHSLSRVKFQTVALLLAAAFASPAAAQDPVEDLRQVLGSVSLDLLGNPGAEVLNFRRNNIQQRVDALKDARDLRRALMLEEWNLPEGDIGRKGDSVDRVRLIDADMRKIVGERLTAVIRQIVKNGDATSRLAVANMIAEMGPAVRSLDVYSLTGYARTLAPELIQLVHDRDVGVRQEALRALGNINPDPKEVVPVFKDILQHDSVGPKRLAADGLSQLVKVTSFLQKPSKTAPGVKTSRADVMATILEVSQAAPSGLADADPQVQGLCLDAIQRSAQALADQVPDMISRKEFPPTGRKLTDEEKKSINDINDAIRRETEDVQPMVAALKVLVPAILKGTTSPEARVRLSALTALESIGNARFRMKRRITAVPQLVSPEETGEQTNQIFFSKIDPLFDFIQNDLGQLTNQLKDPDTRVRRMAIDVFEILEGDAVPVIPALANSLSDPDRFVRWSAARAIGNIGPVKAEAAAPALGVLLLDNDLSLRLAAASTLEAMGPWAIGALPSMLKAAARGDTDSRVAVMYALIRVGPEAVNGVPQFIENLSHPDLRVRRTAADVLGKLGPSARQAVPALRRALGDEEQEVRINASDALLAILQTPSVPAK